MLVDLRGTAEEDRRRDDEKRGERRRREESFLIQARQLPERVEHLAHCTPAYVATSLDL
jgi:hypothetical protein